MDPGLQYANAKKRLLSDRDVCSPNRRLFARFLEHEEYKLKRRNGLAALDRHCLRTLISHVTRLRTVNRWFKNKAWATLTRRDIQRVYDDLEEGRILTLRGERIRDRETYYRKVLRAKPFELAGKAELVRDVMQFYRTPDQQEVRFISEEVFRGLVDVMIAPEHRLLAWLCFDIGENASSLLALRKADCVRQVGEERVRLQTCSSGLRVSANVKSWRASDSRTWKRKSSGFVASCRI